MLWMVALVALLPLTFVLADAIDGGWDVEAEDEHLTTNSGPDLLAQVMQEGTEAEPVWGSWLRVTAFDPDTDLLVVDAPETPDLHITSAVSAEGHTYLMLSDGTRIVLDQVTDLARPAEEFVYFAHP